MVSGQDDLEELSGNNFERAVAQKLELLLYYAGVIPLQRNLDHRPSTLPRSMLREIEEMWHDKYEERGTDVS